MIADRTPPLAIVASRDHVARTMTLAAGQLLPRTAVGGSVIYAGFAVLYMIAGSHLLAAVTGGSALAFLVLARWIGRRSCTLPRVHRAIGACVALVLLNVSVEYAWSGQYLHGIGIALTLAAAGIVLPTTFWMVVYLLLGLAAWVVITVVGRIEIVVFEGTLTMFSAATIGIALFQMRRRTTALSESLRLSVDATRDRELRGILDATADPILLHRAGTIVYANPAFATLLATTTARLVGRSITEFTSATSLDNLTELLEQRELSTARGAGGLGPYPITLTRSDGEAVTIELAEPRSIWFDRGPAEMWSGRDIDAAQQALHARLLAADRMAVAGTLAAGLAHELNNPLTVARLNLDLLKGEPSPAMQSELVTEIASSLRRVEGIVGELAALSSTSAPRDEVELERAVRQAVTLAHNELRQHAEVVLELAPTPPVRIAPTKLIQAIVNLLVFFARQLEKLDEAGRQVFVETSTSPDHRVVLAISAPRVEISTEAAARMFEPFFTTNADGFGAGLGLYYCHSVITGAGGTLQVHTAPTGTTIRVSLPPSATAASPRETIAQATGTETIRVLVIDDEQAVGRVISRVLSHCKVVALTSGVDAVTQYEALRPDLVLCDIMMPDLSGPTVYEMLRAKYPEIERQIVFMTGGAFTKNARSFVESTELPVLKKPIALAELRDLVRRYATSPR